MKLTKEVHDLIDAQADEIDYGTITIRIKASEAFIAVTSQKDTRVYVPIPPAPGVIAEEGVKREG